MMARKTTVPGTYPDSTLDAQAENKELTHALSAAFQGSGLTDLHLVLGYFNPNIVRAHTCGTGNALHQALRYITVFFGLYQADKLQPILDVLVAHGATLDTPCEDYDAGIFRDKCANLYDWMCVQYDKGAFPVAHWIRDTLVPCLLTAGVPWGELDQRDDAIGQAVRQHPAWIRHQLNAVAGNETADTPSISRQAPKL